MFLLSKRNTSVDIIRPIFHIPVLGHLQGAKGIALDSHICTEVEKSDKMLILTGRYKCTITHNLLIVCLNIQSRAWGRESTSIQCMQR